MNICFGIFTAYGNQKAFSDIQFPQSTWNVEDPVLSGDGVLARPGATCL